MALGQDVIVGREAIFAFWDSLPKVRIKSHRAAPDTIVISGNQAYDYGYIHVAHYSIEGELQKEKSASKYFIIWEKTPKDGWNMKMDMWNSRNPGL